MRRAILHLKQADPVLRAIIERVGPYRIQYAEPDFETLARSIVFQQLSGKSARAIFARLKGAAGAASRMTPEGILALGGEDLRRVGLSQQKTKYLRDIAEKTQAGSINFRRLSRLSDEAVIDHLTAAKGVGVWTAQMFLLFALRRPDVLATGDLGIRSAIRRGYRLRVLPTHAKVEKIGKKWHPYCSVACWYLWRSTDNLAGI
ncbi:MAG: DNA-3-methyladenine glycosylase 2 family protein [candidate division NC10 bacterium]|nr:DNA-3-methyladenine glycosylase 2 family protein [candidate division NC10 bacterium]MBI2115094.1 DNA-3-methyladenine glycosylase 2 family protein [candidate division NC10 bacterium]MBI2164352.1 DNA-3-methyladenine glycosylase 2 family protein [candidate division NC10 bacterium]MBI2455204.1 DNA-3-methyladenine glycosylase 2 family protein [candidate division NC10 bacterium]MBI3084862.1 DNA-3-methyladenine glycosylase 2 family protein [candidate division NC10 bacterium]